MVSARAAAQHALVALERGRNERLRDVLDAMRLSGREQGLAYELAHGCVRRERLLDHVLGGLAHRGLPKDPAMLCALRLGAYQLMFVDGMPAHSAVDETVKLVRSNKGFANALLRRIAERIEPRPALADKPLEELALGPLRMLRLPLPLPQPANERLAIQFSLPPFLVDRWLGAFGSEAVQRIGAAACSVPSVYLRLSIGVDATALGATLAAAGVITEPVEGGRFLRCKGGESPFGSEPFRRGEFVAQDPTAFAAVSALPCRPGSTVVDMCAAPGTKTTWLGSMVRPDGHVTAYDPDETRRHRIDENVARLQLSDLVTVVDSLDELQPADAVLVDVPCSNSGVLGRRVEVRRRLNVTTFARMAALQRTLLRRALELVKPGGHLVYSTCSIDHDENDAVVDAVLADRGDGFEVRQRQLTLPLAGAHDGGYFALIRRS